MAVEDNEADKEDGVIGDKSSSESNGKLQSAPKYEEEGSEEEEEEDEEPRLKYASLTKHLKAVYKNGDATSTSLVAGDKMVSFAQHFRDVSNTNVVPDRRHA